MDLKFLFYVFLSIVLVATGTFRYFRSGQELAAGSFFVGAIAAVLYFGFRWFTPSGEVLAGGKGGWPPMINYCPDFLSLHTLSSGEQVCVDTIGVSRGGLPKLTNASTTDERFFFKLHLNTTGEARTKKLCDECVNKKVTWEGVYDGSICTGNEPPAPPKSAYYPGCRPAA